MTSDLPLLTREIFGNVSAFSKGLFYALALAAVAAFVWGIARRVRLWRRGRPSADRLSVRVAAANVLRNVLLQRRVRRRQPAGTAHLLLFGGFLVLFAGTVLIGIEHVLADLVGREPRNPLFHKGLYFAIYEVVLDTAGLALLIGCALFARRRRRRSDAIAHDNRDWLVLGLFATIGVTGYILEGLRIVREQTPLPGLSYVGYAFAALFDAGALSATGAARWHAVLWWVHAVLSLALIAWFPWSRLLHAIAGAVRLAAGIDRLGTLAPVSLEEFEAKGELGAARFEDLSRRQLVELDACVSCGRCELACPAFEAGKPLSPRNVVQDLRRYLDEGVSAAAAPANEAPEPGMSLAGGVVAEETLWSCTTCSACVDVCPLGVNPLGMITEMRRRLVFDGQLRGAPALALQRSDRSGNPWGLGSHDRLAWAAGLNVPTVAENPAFEVLYWVGCAAAYDRRTQRVAQSMVRLLKAANVNFAVLGPRERCTGEACRRMGDEFLFQKLAGENIAAFEESGVTDRARRVVSHCPHCVNSFRSDYPQLGAQLDVVHHTEFLAELVRAGRLRLKPDSDAAAATTYHDPCYLARVAGITTEPRELLAAASTGAIALREMPRNGRQTSCCGAGGGRMWFDDTPATRIGRARVEEALSTGAATLAVACPFCLTMMTDGTAARESAMAVRDVAEILAERLDT